MQRCESRDYRFFAECGGERIFHKEVNERLSRFEDAITRNKLSTFASEGVKLKTKNNNKISEVRMERNLYGRLLCIALVESIDISLVLTYPITPVPLSMCHIDGTMVSTSKHKLVAPLEKRISSLQPEHVDCHVLDGMFSLRTKIFHSSYGRLLEIILKKVCALKSSRIDLVFDSYTYHSINDLERDQRGADRSTTYKKTLIDFLMKDWNHKRHTDMIGNKKVYITSQEQCVSFENINGNFVTNEEYQMYSKQEEANYTFT